MESSSTRKSISSDTPWEASVGYSRAVRVGNHVFVSGTTASTSAGEAVAIGDAYGQTKFILQKIESVLNELGGTLADVVRTRMFVTDISKWEEVGKAHGEAFGNVRPSATMVEVQRLILPEHLVEMEVDAVIVEEAG